MASAPRHDDRSAMRSDLTGTSEAVRTPGPLSFEQGFILADGEALKVVGVQIPMVVGAARLEAIANAAFIVRAWNSHDELVAALREARDALNGAPNTIGLHSQIEAALSKATGEA